MPQSVVVGIGSAAFLLLSCGVVLWIGSAAARGNLPRNHSAGIRTQWTLASDAAWAAGHAAGGRRVRIGGIGGVCGSLVAGACGLLPIFGASENVANSAIAASLIATCLWLVAWMLAAARAANRAARMVS